MKWSTPFKVAGALAAGSVVAVQLAQARIRAYETIDPTTVDLPGSMFFLRGLGLHFIDTGDPPEPDGGPPLLLLHSVGGSTFDFRHQLPVLATRRRVLAVDLPGHGWSDRPTDRDLSFAAQAALLDEFLTRLAIPRVVTVGHSMGGGIAYHLAVARPERVARLVAVGAVPPDYRLWFPGYQYVRPWLPIAGAVIARDRFIEKTVRGVMYDGATLSREAAAGWLRPWRVRGTMASLIRLGADVQRQPTLDPARVSQRTLLLHGEADPVIRLSIAQRVHQQLPDARLEVLPRAGHLVLEEQIAASNDAILRFLAEPERPR